MVPLSSFAYLKTVSPDKISGELVNKSEVERKTKTIVWGRDQIDEI
jgi:hypothetical protein